MDTMKQYRTGFVVGSDSFVRKGKLVAKYLSMKMNRMIYPDVYCVPLFISDSVDLIRDGEKIPANKYDIIFSELNASNEQLEYLNILVDREDLFVIVIPGPPEIIGARLDHQKALYVRDILIHADQIWTYSENIRQFCDGLIGFSKAKMFFWPFNLEQTLNSIHQSRRLNTDKINILLNCPLRFVGPTQNYPFVIKSILMDILNKLPNESRGKITFHTYIYTEEDKKQFHASNYSNDFPVKLRQKQSYRSFLNFINSCDAIINLTIGTILGRVTFISAALNKPGLFSNNSDVNTRLYPTSSISILNVEELRNKLASLLLGLSTNKIKKEFFPSKSEIARLGDFKKNSEKVRVLLEQAFI